MCSGKSSDCQLPAGAVHNGHNAEGHCKHDDADNGAAEAGRHGTADRLEDSLRVEQHDGNAPQLLEADQPSRDHERLYGLRTHQHVLKGPPVVGIRLGVFLCRKESEVSTVLLRMQ